MKIIFTLLVLASFSNQTHAQNFKFGKVSEEEVLEKVHPIDKEANAAVLYREQKTYYEVTSYAGFTLVTDVHERIKIYNKDGFSWATREIMVYKDGTTKEDVEGLKAYTYSLENGKVREEKLDKNGIFEEKVDEHRTKIKLTLPAVTEGSVIEIKYTIRSPFVTDIGTIPLQYSIPINKLEAQVRIPEYLVFKRHLNPKSPLMVPVQEGIKNFGTSLGGEKLEYIENKYDIALENVPALKEESHIDYLQNYAAFVKWELQLTKFPNSMIKTFSTTWEDVVKSIYKDGGFSKELGRSVFEEDLKKVLSGVTDPVQKANVILQFVKNKVKWNGNRGFTSENGVKTAYKSGTGNVGDINLLLIAALNHAGLKASPVLVSTKDNGIPIFPTREGFNYVVSAVELADGIVLLDATDKNAGFGELPWRARNWQGRLIQEDGNSSWVDLMPKYQSTTQNVLNVQIGENFVLKGKSMSLIDGLSAKAFRDNFLGMSGEKYLESLEKDKGNIIITDVVKENEEKLGQQIKEEFIFELSNGLEVINDKIYLKPLLFLALEENPFKADERQYPVFFDYPAVHKKTANILLPKGYTVEYLPESVIYELNAGAGTYKFITSHNGNFLRIDSELHMTNTVYTPNDYTALKQFFATMVEKQTEAIVLTKI